MIKRTRTLSAALGLDLGEQQQVTISGHTTANTSQPSDDRLGDNAEEGKKQQIHHNQSDDDWYVCNIE